MSLKECIKLAFYNLYCKKKLSFQLLKSIVVIMTIVVVIAIFSIAIDNGYNEIVYGSASTNNIKTFLDIDEEGNIIENDDYKLYEEMQDHEYFYKPKIIAGVNILNFLGKEEGVTLSINHVSMKNGDLEYMGTNDYSYDFEEAFSLRNRKTVYKVPFKMGIVSLGSEFVTQNERKEFAYKYPGEQIFLCGRGIENADEVIITDYILERFGVQSNFEELIEKTVSFLVDGEELLTDYTIVGIVNSNFYRITYNGDEPQVIISGTGKNYQEYGINYLTVISPIKDYMYCTKAEEVVSDFGIGEYESSFFAEIYYYMARIRAVVQRIVAIMCLFIILAVILNIYNILHINLQENKKYYGMLKAIGMTDKNLICIANFEIIIVTVIALFLSIGLSIGTLYLLNNMIYHVIYTKLEIGVGVFVRVAGVSLLCVCVLLCGITYFNYYKLFRLKIIQLLK